MTILITGSAGLLGSSLSHWLIDNTDCTVVGVDDLSGGYEENMPDHTRFVFRKLDCCDEFLDNIFQIYKPDYVYHFAAYAAEALSPFIRCFNYTNNIVATANVVNCCIRHDVKRLVFSSSMAVYGDAKPPFHEDLLTSPVDSYGVAKQSAELDIQIAGKQHGLDWCIIRPHNCYSQDTEILTENGWKYFKDLKYGESVATLNVDSMQTEYHIPEEYQKIHVDDFLYNFKTEGFDLLVTSDHNMVTRTKDGAKIKKVTAETIFNNPNKYYYWETLKKPYKLKQDGTYPEYVIIPEVMDSKGRPMTNSHQNGGEKRVRSSDFMEFLGWYISEGSMFKTPSNYTICISQNEKINKDNYELIKDCVKRIGFNFYETGTDIKIHSKQLFIFLDQLFPQRGSHYKLIPRQFLNYSCFDLNILFDSLMRGDGRKNMTAYNTSSEQLANDFQELCFKIGIATTIRKEHSKCGRYSIYRISIIHKNTNPSFGDMYTKKIYASKIRYSGFVYDVTVKNHIIYVRRNGKTCWGSNCYGTRQNLFDPYRNFIGIAMYKGLIHDPITVYGDGEQKRAFSFIDDILQPLYSAAVLPQASKQIINLGGVHEHSINEVANIVSRLSGSAIIHLPPRHEVKYAYATWEKSEKILQFQHKTNLIEGIEKMWDWAKTVKMRPRFVWDTYELSQNLYPFWEKEALKDGYYKRK